MYKVTYTETAHDSCVVAIVGDLGTFHYDRDGKRLRRRWSGVVVATDMTGHGQAREVASEDFRRLCRAANKELRF